MSDDLPLSLLRSASHTLLIKERKKQRNKRKKVEIGKTKETNRETARKQRN
jgi:hypothetical protein